MTLGDVVAPLSVDEFVERYLGRDFQLWRGQAGRFAHLLPWTAVNEALDQLRVLGNRLRVVKGGKEIDQQAFLAEATSERGAYVNARALTKLLAGGATLALNQIDELVPGVKALAQSCEETLRIHVGVNMYAGWKRENGFDLHWDEHDTMILQVSGRKQWTVYRPTRLHPIAGERTKAEKPTEEPVWDGVLEDGDVLYMPRGWWHVAVPMDEPSLHLTMGFHHRTGVELLRWVASQMTEEVEARMDVPHWRSEGEQRAWIDALRERVLARLSAEVVTQFLRDTDFVAVARPNMFLPETATGVPVTVLPDTPLRVTTGSRLNIDVAPGGRQAAFQAAGGAWRCDAGLVPALEMLRYSRPTTLAQMAAVVESSKVFFLDAFVKALVLADVLWAEPPARSQPPATREATSQAASAADEPPSARIRPEAVAAGEGHHVVG